nr:CIH_HP1_G0034430.mRNA.1.CDS.1 [Saccharomyces cerevisiae]
MCLSKASTYPKTRTIEPAAFVLDKSTSRCIYYQDLPLPSSREKTSIQIDPELLDNVDEFVIRNDLIDCRIDICTSHVPLIFQENFDYQSLRTDCRWCYPLVLDSNIQDDQTYSYESRHIYKEKRRCFGPILIKNSFIWDDCIIGNNSIIDHSLIASNATLGSNVRLNDGCIIGFNVKIDDNMDLDRNTKISASPLKMPAKKYDNESNEQFDQDLDDQTLAVSIVGDRGVGYIYESEVSDDEDSSTEACKRNKHFE